jgi:O-antigen ligase
VAVLAVRRARTRRARIATYWTLAALVLAGGALVTLFSRQLLALLGKSDTLTGRLGIWDAVIGLAQQRPVAGWGWISYWAPWVAPFKNLVKKAGVQQLHAHNAWLDVWLQLGILGVVVFAALVLLTGYRAWRMATRPLAMTTQVPANPANLANPANPTTLTDPPEQPQPTPRRPLPQ